MDTCGPVVASTLTKLLVSVKEVHVHNTTLGFTGHCMLVLSILTEESRHVTHHFLVSNRLSLRSVPLL